MDAASFVKLEDMESKVKVLETLDDLVEFEQAVEMAGGSANDVALIESFRDLKRGGLPRSNSDVYWHRNTGDQDFEACAKERAPQPQAKQAKQDYWDAYKDF